MQGREIMDICEFIKKVNSTQDLIHYYEEMNLINPMKEGNKLRYTEKDINDFQTIQELELLGLSMNEIHLFFQIKRSKYDDTTFLLQKVQEEFKGALKKIEITEKELALRKAKIYALMMKLENIHNEN